MIDGVLFDLDDTLCAYRRPSAEVLATAFERAGVEPLFSVGDYFRAFDDHIRPGQPFDAQRESCFAALAGERGVDPEVGRAVARAFAGERDHREVDCTPGAREALETLAGSHRVGLVTNGPPDMQSIKLEALGLADAFETVVHAGHDAPAKPAPEPFHRALEALSVEPERAVHVGNSLSADVAGAKAAGLRAAWLAGTPDADPGDHAPDYVLSSLAELAEPPWLEAE